jgi:FkbM family methyltransferase
MKIDFVQIGANVGNNKYDIIWKLSRQKDWKGLLVEPLPKSFEILKENYSDMPGMIFENCAIMDYDGTVELHYAPDFMNECQQASVNLGHWPENLATEEVPCLTIESLLEKHNLLDTEFEILQIDVEGVDDRVILATDFSRIRAKYVRWESIHLRNRNAGVIKHLAKFGYTHIDDMYDHMAPGEPGYDSMVVRG